MTTQIKKFSQGDMLYPVVYACRDQGADTAHKFPGLSETICKSLNVDLLCMGEKDGRPAIYTPITNAGVELRVRGVLVSENGAWKLTPLGKRVASGAEPMPAPDAAKTAAYWAAKRAEKGKPAKVESKPAKPAKEPKPEKEALAVVVAETTAPVVVAAPAPVVAPEPVVVAPEPVKAPETPAEIADRLVTSDVTRTPAPATKPKTKVSVIVDAPGAPDWAKDPYIRGLVAGNTPCFGSWSPTAAQCSSCPLAAPCRNALSAGLTAIAAKLREAEVTRATAKAHEAAGSLLSASSPRETAAAVAGKKMRASFDGICARSGKPIKAGDECYFVPGEGIVSGAAHQAAEAGGRA